MRLLGCAAAAVTPVVLALLTTARFALAHAGPPYPIVTDRDVGGYRISVWTDPDATDDRTPGGQFWVIVHPLVSGVERDVAPRVTVTARPLDRPGADQTANGAQEKDEPSRYFSNLVLDHEGRWRVVVSLEGLLGAGSTSADVDATYDLRPPVATLPFLLLPFVLVGLLWLKALRARPGKRRRPSAL